MNLRRRATRQQVASLAAHGLFGWAVCGGIVAIGRRMMSLRTTLLIHAIVAPLVFAILTWHYTRRFHATSAIASAAVMTTLVIALDALVVAPVLEHSYAMFRSPLGTWLPFTLIAAASYLAARTAGTAT